MIQLQALIKPTWAAEEWLNQAWSILNDDEKSIIKQRTDDIFCNELPFQLKHDKILYVHLFALLAQLEILGLQGLLKILGKLTGTALYGRMRQQIMDEIFHAIVFTKITYHLSAPYALPPAYDKGIETLLSMLVNEPDIKTSVVMLNLLGENWIEEMFFSMREHHIAPRVFDVILEDESRHLRESELFLQIGLPDKAYLSDKLARFEEALVKMIFSQQQSLISLVTLLGREGVLNLLNNIDNKHQQALQQIGLKPSKNWQLFMRSVPSLVKNVFYDQSKDTRVEPTITRKILTSLWADPDQPTESAMFSITVSSVGFFEKKFKPETITCLFLQTLSKTVSDNPQLKHYISHHKIYHPEHAYVGLVVRLPDCDDHLGVIEFKNCHEMSMSELSQHIQHDMAIMTYCYKKTQDLKIKHPFLTDIINAHFKPCDSNIYRDPLFAKPTIALSNIGHWGYESAISPLFPNETVKLTLTKIERKQVWNNTNKQFEVQDILPVGLSADHRVFDGNIPLPYLMQTGFDHMFTAMTQSLQSSPLALPSHLDEFIHMSEQLLQDDLEFGFRYLFFAGQVWKNHMSRAALLKKVSECEM